MRRTLPALVPVAAGLAAAAVLLAAAPGLTITVGASVALCAAVAGVLVSAVVLLVITARRRSAAGTTEAAERAAGQERAAAAAARRRLLLRLDHELKNPLTALLAALADGRTDAAHRQAERIRGLLTDLRRIVDVETAPLETAVLPVETVLRDAVDLVAADTGRDVRLDVPSAPWPPTVDVDPDLLLVAVHNVVANAVKYSAPGDVVEVRARESRRGDASTVTIEVADTGPGIAEEDREAVWEELARGHPPSDVPGSGVGLALVRLIVERHGGTADLSSRVGTGTAVALHLPAARPVGT